MSDLKILTDQYLKDGGNLATHDKILTQAIIQNDQEGLEQVVKLAKDDYGGGTYKWELKHTANIVVLNWGEEGLDAIYKMAIKDQNMPNVKGVITLLAYVACGKPEEYSFVTKSFNSYKKLKISSKKYKSESLKIKAKTLLVDLIKEVEREDKFPFSLLSSLQTTYLAPDVQEQIFVSLIMRWFHLSGRSIENYYELINSKNNSEPHCHNFLKQNPFLLEPFYSKLWSKPRYGELFVPDFVLKSMDNSYTIFEIEDPNKPIITKSGNLSSQATHAKRQALEYREWVISNQLYAKTRFPDIWRPTAVVVIGMEKKLTEAQKMRLNQENESTQGILKIVGFDWIYERAKISFHNTLQYGFDN